MPIAYYERGIPNQTQGILTRPAVGLNEYTPSSAINENYMSDMIDVEGYREEAIKFYNTTTATKLFSTQGLNEGRAVSIFDSELSTTTDYTFYGMAIKLTEWNLFVAKYIPSGASSLTKYAMTIPSVPALTTASALRYSKAMFRTEADVFYCFAANNYTRLHYLKYNYEKLTNTYGYVDLPFYPASMVSHANRIFAIDTRNKLWWCRAGDLFSWYSLEYDADSLVASANMGNKTHTLAGTIDTPRVVTATCTTTNTADTRGILTITGTNPLGNSLVAVLTLYEGRVQTSEVFATVTSVVQSGWTQGGASPDTITVGVGPLGFGHVVDDAGYWTIEGEPYVFELFTISNILYVSAGVSIYAFRGYSYETFSLQRIVSNLGNPAATLFGYKQTAVIRNKAYFISGSDIYEFNGDSAPRLISRPVYVNNALTNGIMGGVDFSKNTSLTTTSWVLEADTNSLYVYSGQAEPSVYYKFDFNTRTWWKLSGWTKTTFSTANSVYVRLVPKYSNDDVIPFFRELLHPTEDSFWFVLGDAANGVTQGTVYPFVITKSFQSLPSHTGTLTDIVLAIKGTLNNTADITVAYNNTENGTTFTTIKAYADKVFTGDLEILKIPMPVSAIASKHHYRIKITISDLKTNAVYLYNVERRFRVRGYSR